MRLALAWLLFLLAAGQVGGQLDLLDQEKKNLADVQAQCDQAEEDIKQLPELRSQLRLKQTEARAKVGRLSDPDGVATLRHLPARGLTVTCEKKAAEVTGGDAFGFEFVKVRLSGSSARVLAWLEAVERSPRGLWLTYVDLKSTGPGQLGGTVNVVAVPKP